MRSAVSLWFGVCLAACNLLRGGGHPVLVRAVDDRGQPVAHVEIAAENSGLGVTDASGRSLLHVPGSEGQRVEFKVTCPAGYERMRERPSVVLQRGAASPGTEPAAAAPVELKLTCETKKQAMVVALRTGQPGLPVLLRGQPVAQTSATGTAHVLLLEPAGSSVQLTLDTSESPDLRPESPKRAFAVAASDGFGVWDQSFELDKKPRPHDKRGKSKAAASSGGRAKRGSDSR